MVFFRNCAKQFDALKSLYLIAVKSKGQMNKQFNTEELKGTFVGVIWAKSPPRFSRLAVCHEGGATGLASFADFCSVIPRLAHVCFRQSC